MDLIIYGLIAVGFNLLMFLPAYLFKTDKLTDISYSLTFLLLAIIAFGRSDKSMVHIILLALISVWALRLGLFLLYRIHKMGRDKRFDERRNNFTKFLGFWLLQGISVPVILAAALLTWSNYAAMLDLTATLGIVVFAVGLALESTADIQKFRFNQIAKNNSWIDEGVWRISRHPNYLGEMMVWIGVYLIAFASLSDTGKLLGLISPIYIIFSLLFVSGVPLLEKAADKKWGTDKKYLAYKQSVPVLLPSIKSILRLTK